VKIRDHIPIQLVQIKAPTCENAGGGYFCLAESWGFEPQIGFAPYTRLAGEHLRPLGQLSNQ
jgi:hypothetical protein